MAKTILAADYLTGMVTARPRAAGANDPGADVPPMDAFFANAKREGRLVLVPPEVQALVEKKLGPEDQVRLQQTLKQAKRERVIPSRHRYTLRHENKNLRRRILGSYRELDVHRAHLIALAIQENAEIASLDICMLDALANIRSKLRLPNAGASR